MPCTDGAKASFSPTPGELLLKTGNRLFRDIQDVVSRFQTPSFVAELPAGRRMTVYPILLVAEKLPQPLQQVDLRHLRTSSI